MFWYGASSFREPETALEIAALYASGVYLIVVVIAASLWMWSRLQVPKEPASSEWGERWHKEAVDEARRHRNLALLAFLPLIVLIVAPALLTLHLLTALAVILALSAVTLHVIRHAYRFLTA